VSAPTVQYGNTEFPVSLLLRLGPFGSIGEQDDEEDTLYLKLHDRPFSRTEALELIQIVAELRPDECTLEDDEGRPVLRFWWD
jgi:hypothetical protein